MTMNLRVDGAFVQDEGWYAAQKRYASFIENYKDKENCIVRTWCWL